MVRRPIRIENLYFHQVRSIPCGLQARSIPAALRRDSPDRPHLEKPWTSTMYFGCPSLSRPQASSIHEVHYKPIIPVPVIEFVRNPLAHDNQSTSPVKMLFSWFIAPCASGLCIGQLPRLTYVDSIGIMSGCQQYFTASRYRLLQA